MGHPYIPYAHAAGKIRYTLTNDFAFKYVMQKNNHVLIALLSALLQIPEGDISSANITNPILIDDFPDDKTVVLDINVLLNNQQNINLEMQIVNQHNWVERSTYYLCMNYTSLKSSEDYSLIKPSCQIGILDYTLFPESPEFYANYYLTNRVTHKIYTDKLRLSVLDLTQIDLATEEDRKNKIDLWARLFKETTWEGYKMLAQKDTIVNEVGDTLYNLSQEEFFRSRCLSREKARMDQLWEQRSKERLENEKEELCFQIEQYRTQVEQYRTQNEQFRAQSEQLQDQNVQLQEALSDKEQRIHELEAQIAQMEKRL